MRIPFGLCLGFAWVTWSVVFAACHDANTAQPDDLLNAVSRGCESKDLGFIKDIVDINYQDDLGGVGHLEDDLRQLFAVYGSLQVQQESVSVDSSSIQGTMRISGKKFLYHGPFELKLKEGPYGFLIQSGLFTELRGILYTLRQRRIAQETISPDQLERFISKDYKGAVTGRDDLMKKIRKEFLGLPEHAMVVDDLAIIVDGDLAQVNQQIHLIIPWEGRTIEKSQLEKLALKREGDRWRFVGGLG